jgi:hypothetical protein
MCGPPRTNERRSRPAVGRPEGLALTAAGTLCCIIECGGRAVRPASFPAVLAFGTLSPHCGIHGR